MSGQSITYGDADMGWVECVYIYAVSEGERGQRATKTVRKRGMDVQGQGIAKWNKVSLKQWREVKANKKKESRSECESVCGVNECVNEK